jgi:exonuclease III
VFDPRVLLVRVFLRAIGASVEFKSRIPWVADELRRFAPNLMAFSVKVGSGASINVACIYAPAWPVSRDRLKDVDVRSVKLAQNPDVWVADLLVAALREQLNENQTQWVLAGDFNSCESFDMWKGGPRGNREWLNRMAALGFTECLRYSQGALTPTFRRPGKEVPHCQIDHFFVSNGLAQRLISCRTGDLERVYSLGLSDHLPIVADFQT